jgi:signal transduction histidine kinase
VAGAEEASLDFVVLPAWHESAWFAALGVLTLVALGFGAAFSWQRARSRLREERLHARFEATLEERTRVARELHDTLLSGFTGITLQLQALRRAVREAPDRAAERLDGILATADDALRDARLMIWDMRTSARDQAGLVPALERAARDAVQGTEIVVDVDVRGEQRPLPATLESTLRRVGREAVLNAVRHAAARQVRIELVYEPDAIALTVTDDGRGLSPEEASAASAAGHWGLSGMRERAERAGGTLTVSAAAGAGTVVRISLPTTGPV